MRLKTRSGSDSDCRTVKPRRLGLRACLHWLHASPTPHPPCCPVQAEKRTFISIAVGCINTRIFLIQDISRKTPVSGQRYGAGMIENNDWKLERNNWGLWWLFMECQSQRVGLEIHKTFSWIIDIEGMVLCTKVRFRFLSPFLCTFFVETD